MNSITFTFYSKKDFYHLSDDSQLIAAKQFIDNLLKPGVLEGCEDSKAIPVYAGDTAPLVEIGYATIHS